MFGPEATFPTLGAHLEGLPQTHSGYVLFGIESPLNQWTFPCFSLERLENVCVCVVIAKQPAGQKRPLAPGPAMQAPLGKPMSWEVQPAGHQTRIVCSD